MNLATMFLQLGVAGATLYVLHAALVRLIPNAMRPVEEKIETTTEELRMLREDVARIDRCNVRIESKLNVHFDWTPTPQTQPPPLNSKRPRLPTPITGVSTQYSHNPPKKR